MARYIYNSKSNLQRVDPGEPQRLLDAVGQVGVVEDDVEAEGLRPERHGRADPA